MIAAALDVFLHLDAHLNAWAATLGPWLYAVLFAVVFCETGLVATPYLPGDSLLFAVGALAAREGSAISLPLLCVVLGAAAILGDSANYAAGFWAGPRVFSREDSRWLNRRHLLGAQEFYDKYGGKTIVLARFIPVIRTFAPFVAGIGRMNYSRFIVFNVAGGAAWTLAFLLGGYYFSGLPFVREKFHYVVLAIIAISFLPILLEFWKARRKNPKPIPPR